MIRIWLIEVFLQCGSWLAFRDCYWWIVFHAHVALGLTKLIFFRSVSIHPWRKTANWSNCVATCQIILTDPVSDKQRTHADTHSRRSLDQNIEPAWAYVLGVWTGLPRRKTPPTSALGNGAGQNEVRKYATLPVLQGSKNPRDCREDP